jgi:hypothetical protein
MTEPQSIDASQGPTAKNQGPTAIDAPRPDQGKRRCRLNAYRHGLTGQLNIMTPDEQQAYDKHSRIVLEALAPATDFERDIAQSIADDRWRLKRARSIEASVFALGTQSQLAASTGHPQVDEAFSQARAWAEQAHNLALLTIYEQRIHRAMEKNMAHLETLQAKRKASAKQAMEQAKDLYEFAVAQGKPYQPESFFVAAPAVWESVFSTSEVVRELSREKLKSDAHEYHWRGKLPKEKVA